MENVFDEQGRESESIFYQYLSILQKRKGVILAFSGVLIITAIISTMLSTRYYSSKAVIEIMPIAPSIMGKDAGEAVTELGVGSDSRLRVYYGTQFAILASNTILGKAVDKLKFEHGFDDFDEQGDPVAFLRQFLSLKPRPETTLINIKIEYPNPEKAAIMANVIANVYMEHNLENNLQSVRDALSGIEKEHERFREAKHMSDEKVHSFKFENHMIGIEKQSTYIQNKMKALQTELTDIQVQRVQVHAEFLRRQKIFGSSDWLSLAKSFSKTDLILQQHLSARVTLLDEQNKLSIRYTAKHPEMQAIAKQISSNAESIRAEVQQEISSLQTELSVLEAKEQTLVQELEAVQVQVKELDQKMIELAFITSEAEKNKKLYQVLDERMSQVDLAQFMQSNNVRFVDKAVPNSIPVRPSLSLNLAMAIILGGIGGMGLAFLIEFLDNTVKSKEDLESMIGMPLLGVVPVIPQEEMLDIASNRDRSLFTYAKPRSSVAESLRSVRTNVLFHTGTKKSKVLLITSAVPREGKSFSSSNLAAVLAMSGSRVVIIDADLRRPSIHRLFDISDEHGLSEVLLEEKEIYDVMIPSHIPNLDVVPAGPIPTNPSELLGSERLTEITKQLQQEYDIVIFDTPPVTAVADPMILSPMADGVILVVEANQTRKPVVMQAITRLRQVKANLIGGIVNKFDIKRSGYGYYYYYNDYGYYAEDEYESSKLG